MLVEFIKPDFSFEDERGNLVQLIHEGWKQVNVIVSRKGNIRGNHYHKYNVEAFYVVSGRFKLYAKSKENEEIYEIKQGDMFQIHPQIIHTFEYQENTVLVSLYDRGVEMNNGEKDIWR